MNISANYFYEISLYETFTLVVVFVHKIGSFRISDRHPNIRLFQMETGPLFFDAEKLFSESSIYEGHHRRESLPGGVRYLAIDISYTEEMLFHP